ncbi:glycosyltransferase family 4 protein [Nocardioides sp. GXZ039]|uniref:glycosyltransferase family 4 protein n=1 Tax=Nocardioides sp. GXZ039 TaxID=3136018 RepID=UPI0030F40565
MKGLRIAMLGTRGLPATYGGVEHHVDQIGSRLVERGHEVTVYSQSGYAGEPVTEHHGMRVRTLPSVPVRGLEAISHAAMSTLDGLFRRHDVAHYHAVGPGLAAPLARFASRAAIVQTIHGLDAERTKWGRGARSVLNLATWMSARVPDRTITVSRTLAEHYAEQYARACTYVPNGLTPRTRRTADLITERYGLRGGDYVLFVGRLVPEKRPDLLLKAWRRLDTDLRLVVVGGSSHTDDYVAELSRLAADDPRVLLTGYCYGAELDELFTNAVAFVQPSELEGLPLTLLEAMGCGLPVVASDIAPHLEVVGADRPGARLFAEGEVDSLAAALGRALTAPHQERRAAESARRATHAAYDWDSAVDEIEAVYAASLQARARRRRFRRSAHKSTPTTSQRGSAGRLVEVPASGRRDDATGSLASQERTDTA